MKRLFAILLMLPLFAVMKAQDDTPQLEFVVELRVKCEGAYQVGHTSHGTGL